MRKIPVLFIIIGICLVFSESTSYGFGLNISPPSVNEIVKPSGSVNGTITVRNDGVSETGIVAYAEDWLYAPDGSKSFYPAGNTPLSCAKWISLFPKKFQLEPGKSLGVQYSISAPENIEGGYYAVIFFESVPLSELESDKGALTVQFAGRLGAIVYVETEGKSIYKGSIESLSITPPQSNKPLEMTLLFKNTGNVYIGAEGTLNIIDESGKVYGKEMFGPLNTLPGDTREAKVEWLGDLGEGTYYAVVTLDIGSEEPIVKEVKLDISVGGAIKTLSVDASSNRPTFSVLVENKGLLNIEASGRVEVIERDGKLAKSLNLKRSLIAPGKEKKFEAALEEELPQGMYTAKAIVSIGDKEFVKEEVFSIK